MTPTHLLPRCNNTWTGGDFRLVLVLDEVSPELERTVAYLEAVTVQALTIDLITLTVYDVNGVQVALPQRISPDLSAASSLTTPGKPIPDRPPVTRSPGVDAFRASISEVTGEDRGKFEKLITWAEQLASLPNVRLFSNEGTKHVTLGPRIMPYNDGLVTIWNDNQQPYIALSRGGFERHAPDSIRSVEQAIAPNVIGRGPTVRNFTPETLEALTAAYREAGKG